MPELIEKLMVYSTGHHASGKTELCDYLTEQYGFRVVETGAMMRQLYRAREETYADLDIKSYVEQKLRVDGQFFDRELDARIKEAEENSDLIVVNGMRTFSNAERLKATRPDAVHSIVWIDAPIDVLYQRYLKREDDGLPFDKFYELLQLDLALGLDEIKANADFTIENTGGIEDLRRSFDAVLPEMGRNAIELS